MVPARLSDALDEGPILKLAHRLLQLGLCVHDDWSIPRHRFLEAACRRRAEIGFLVSGFNCHLIAAVEENERTVAGALTDQSFAPVDLLFGQNTEGVRGRAKRPRPFEHVSEGMAFGLNAARSCAVPEVPRRRGSADQPQRLRPDHACPRTRPQTTRTRVPSSSMTSGILAP